MKQAAIYLYNRKAGLLTEDETGYTFRYDADYLRLPDAEAVSFTLPLTEQVYRDKVLFPFFDGLIPEGWLLDIAEKSWKSTTAIGCRCFGLLQRLHRCSQCHTYRIKGGVTWSVVYIVTKN